MVSRTASRRKSPSVNGPAAVDAVVEIVRSLWQAVEGTPGADQVKLKKDITQTVNRLRGRVEERLGEPVCIGSAKRMLFDQAADGAETTAQPPPAPRFPEPVLRVYAKDFADHALHHLPEAAKYKSVEEFRKYLAEKLRFNSQATRRRTAALHIKCPLHN